MEPCPNSRRNAEAGFLLIEAVIAVGLIAICAGVALAAVTAVTHATARALPRSSLMLTAQNILIDLRAATAYDPVQLAALAGRSTSFDVNEPGPDGAPRSVHVVASVNRSGVTAAYIGVVSVRAANGTAVTIAATLVQEAPAPGSVLQATIPAADTSRRANSGDPGEISL